LAEAGDLLLPIAAGDWRADRVCGDLHELTNGAKPGRLDRNDFTLFKSVGAVLENLAAASLLVNEADPTSHALSPERGFAATKA
jgi:ornithine cyclodeaminase/alanine dehydrogenase-like protein (mu-crystallin family)